jgi:hypothetical protein
MIPVQIEATLLSFIPLSLVKNMHKFEIRVGFGRKRSWAAQQLMPISRLPFIRRRLPEADGSLLDVYPMTLLEELQSILLAKSGSETESRQIEAHVAAVIPGQSEELVSSRHTNTPDTLAAEPDSSTTKAG